LARFIVLDRDGVINRDSDNYIKSPDEWIPIDGSLEAIARLNTAGYHVIVVTNQSGIARGFYDHRALNAMHDKFRCLLAQHGGKVDAIYYCPHGPDDQCDCRKPKAGLFERAAASFMLDFPNIYSIGDSFRDIEAAQKVGARSLQVRTGKGERTIAKHGADLIELNVPIFDNLASAADFVIEADRN
jgi:D-glycero-D-manno-heptose 1,7-bisphosphate phosphatase